MREEEGLRSLGEAVAPLLCRSRSPFSGSGGADPLRLRTSCNGAPFPLWERESTEAVYTPTFFAE